MRQQSTMESKIIKYNCRDFVYNEEGEQVPVEFDGIKLKLGVAPVEQARTRGKAMATGTGKFRVVQYDTSKTRNYKRQVAYLAQSLYKGKPYTGPLKMMVTFYREIPKSVSKNKRDLMLKQVILPITKPDLSNYVKSIEDGLNGIVWHDDNQIVETLSKKVYGEEPHVTVTVIPLDEYTMLDREGGGQHG